MKRTLKILSALVLSVGLATAAAGCGDPCEKAADKMIECLGKDNKELKKKMEKEKKEGIAECNKSEDRKKKAKECVKHDDCKKFIECMSKK